MIGPGRAVAAVALAATAGSLAGCSGGSAPARAAARAAGPAACRAAGSVIRTMAPFGPRGHQRAEVYLPACYVADGTRRFATVYLLHGASADETQWPDIGIAAAADELIAAGRIPPVIIVMPDGGPAMPDSLAAGLVGDLVPWVDRTYRTLHEPSERAVGGISRGGRVALEAAAARPSMFAAVGGHSPAVGGSQEALAARLGRTTAPIRLDVGRSESLRDPVQRFAAEARSAGATVDVVVGPGHHDRAYWRSQVSRYLLFYARRWRVPPRPGRILTAG